MAQKRGRPGGPRAVYRKFADELRDELRRSAEPGRELLPSFRELARRHAVGLQVVRQGIQVLCAEGVLSRNPRGQFVFHRENACSALRGTVAIVQTHAVQIERDVAVVLASMLSHLAQRQRPALVLQGNLELRRRVPADLSDAALEGILLYGQFNESAFKQYEAVKAPVVVVDQPRASKTLSSVCADNVFAAYDAARRMLALGHRRLALLRFLPLSIQRIDPDSRDRQTGFAAAVREAGLSSEHARIFTRTGLKDGSSAAIKALLAARPRVTAVLAVDPPGAQAVADAAQAAGLSVPDDLSIVVFHSRASNLDRRWTGPCVDLETIGQRAVEVVLARPYVHAHVRIPTAWTEGSTLAPPRR